MLKKRQLDNRTLKAFKIGYSGRFNELYQYLKSKGFTDAEILESGLANKKNQNGQFIDRYRNRLMFPIVDTRERVIAFGGRVLDDSKPKYINSPENVVYSKGRHLFAFNIAKKRQSQNYNNGRRIYGRHIITSKRNSQCCCISWNSVNRSSRKTFKKKL